LIFPLYYRNISSIKPNLMDKIFDFENSEKNIYENWLNSGLFNPDKLELPDNAPSYSIVLPPPNVTGVLHIGHASILATEDLLIRYHRLKGERALWIPGTDHAAIATQTKVEKIIKEQGESRHSLGREKFLERVRDFAQKSHDTIIKQSKRMGSSLDWSREAYTLAATRNRAVNLVFKMMYEDGLIYRGERIVNWCPNCHSTLADDETEYQSQAASLYFFKYSNDFPITIATTRPETKLGDTAVAVNPSDERYKHLIGQEFSLDFLGTNLKIKIIGDHNVDKEFGSGAVGVTPAHSAVDWQMAVAHSLPIIKVIDEDGLIKNGFGQFSGLKSEEARKLIVEKLKESGLLEKEEKIENNISLCYRCNTPIEPLTSKQWFIDVNKPINRLGDKSLKEISLEAVKTGIFGRQKINIFPERFEQNYLNWMENLRDWCISRQIWFGHPVPAWRRQIPGQEEEVAVSENKPEGDGWEADTDTLDTWFSSGMWTFSTMAHKPEDIRVENGRLVIDTEDFSKYHPTSVLDTAYDIIFFWVARMIIMTAYAINDIPFQDVLLQGLVLDEKGKKMSKSKGNAIDPVEMIEKYGADATRLSLLVGSTPGSDMRLSEDKIAGSRNLVNKLWNISRYILQSTAAEDDQEIVGEKLSAADSWIIAKLNNLKTEISDDIEHYRLSEAGEKLRQFTWDLLADWYIEASKFSDGTETKKVLRHVLREILKLWHPFTPFVSEAIWQEFNSNLLMGEKFSDSNKIDADLNSDANLFEKVIDIVRAIRNARTENQVEPSRKIKALIISENAIALEGQNRLIKSLRTGLEKLDIAIEATKPEKAILATAGRDSIYLLDAIDEEKERQRLDKEINNLISLVEHAETRLANEEFITKAPAALVEKEKNNLNNLRDNLEKLKKQRLSL